MREERGWGNMEPGMLPTQSRALACVAAGQHGLELLRVRMHGTPCRAVWRHVKAQSTM